MNAKLLCAAAVAICAEAALYPNDLGAQPPSLERHYLERTYIGRSLYYLKRADNRLELGDYAGAAADYRRGLDFDPKSSKLREGKSRALAKLEQQQDQEAAHQLQKTTVNGE